MNIKCNGGGGGGSEGEDGYIFQSPLNANGMTSRKRIKLQAKVSGDRSPVDPALVPRRVRSAMKNRTSQSQSPPLSDSKKQQHASISTQLFKGFNSEGFKQRMLDEVTKDEEEVAEALTSMANFITSKPVKTKVDRMLEENPEKKATLASRLEAPEEENTKKLLVPCNATTTSNPSPFVEDSPPTVKAGPSASGQPVATSSSQKFDIEANGASRLNPLSKISSNMEKVENVVPFENVASLSNPLGAPQHFPVNGTLHPTHFDSCLVQSKEMGLWPLGPASVKPEFVMHDSEQAPSVQPGSHMRVHEKLKMPPSSKLAANKNCYDVSGRHYRVSGLPTEKLPMAPADKKRPWSRCITHVNISRLIQKHHKAEKKQLPTPQFNQLKAKEATNHNLPTYHETSGSRNGMIPQLSRGSVIENNMLEVRNRMLQDGGRLLHAQQVALSGSYAQQKQGCDFLSLSAIGNTKSSGNRMKATGQLLLPYPPSQGVMPFTFPQGSYSSQYQENLAAGATQQVQLHLPANVSNSQLYGQHMGQAAGATETQQQQLMWQAHLAHYRPPINF